LFLALSTAGLSYIVYNRQKAAEQARQQALARLLAIQASILAEHGQTMPACGGQPLCHRILAAHAER
jgi:hypothetical protein